jgi:hypothetical protein
MITRIRAERDVRWMLRRGLFANNLERPKCGGSGRLSDFLTIIRV